jgi:hypothetical protein
MGQDAVFGSRRRCAHDRHGRTEVLGQLGALRALRGGDARGHGLRRQLPLDAVFGLHARHQAALDDGGRARASRVPSWPQPSATSAP